MKIHVRHRERASLGVGYVVVDLLGRPIIPGRPYPVLKVYWPASKKYGYYPVNQLVPAEEP